MSQSNSVIGTLTNIFVAPEKAYGSLKDKPSVAFPLLMLCILNGLLLLYYYTQVDFNWLIEHLVQLEAGDKSPAEQEGMRDGMRLLGSTGLGVISAISVAVFLAIILVLQATYLVIVSNVVGDEIKFKQWLAFASWSMMPTLVGTFASYVSIAIESSAQIAPESINPISLNALFFNLPINDDLGAVLAQTDLSLLWAYALMVLGYHHWTKRSLIKSAVIVLTPFIVITLARILF